MPGPCSKHGPSRSREVGVERDEMLSYRRTGFGLQTLENMERETGFEPATSSLGSWHSTTELLPLAAISGNGF